MNMPAAADADQPLLALATRQYLNRMHAWFPDAERCLQWGGPRFRFPYTPESFAADCGIDQLASYAMLNQADELLAFGQYYRRLDRCHLGRLAVNPAHRGQGHGVRLIAALSHLGRQDLDTTECSLFVLADNPPANALYRKLGFEVTDYPYDDIDLEHFYYMTTAHTCLDRWRQDYPCRLPQNTH